MQCQHRYFRRAIYPDRHIHRTDAATHEHRGPSEAADAGHDRKLLRRNGAKPGQHDLTAVSVTGQYQRDIELGGFR